MAVDLFLLLFVVVIVAAAISTNTYLLLYFQSSEDSPFGSSVFCKTIIVISLTLAWLVNILLPIDVRNSRPQPGVLDMQALWSTAFITLAIFLELIVPAVTFYYEVEKDNVVVKSAKSKRRHVLCNLTLLLFFSATAIAVSFPFLSNAEIPVTEYSCSTWVDATAEVSRERLGEVSCSNGIDAHIQIKVGLHIYIVAVLCFLGWFFFVLFGGIGLSAIPIDLILEFVDRPRAIDEYTYQRRRKLLAQCAKSLREQVPDLQTRDGEVAGTTGWRGRRTRQKLRADYNKFRRDFLLLETEFERLKLSKFHKGENLAVSVLKLTAGILSAVLSIMWVLHIILYILVRQAAPSGFPATTFLNGMFAAFESSGLFPLGVALFATFTLYLLLCVVKGCLKFGMRIVFLFAIHPMRHKSTPLNSILFNVEMVLISSAAVVQFSQVAFADYARLTDADIIFSAQIKYMSFYSWFFQNNVFIYMLLGWFLLTLLYLLIRPRDTSDVKFDEKADKKLAKLAGIPADILKSPSRK